MSTVGTIRAELILRIGKEDCNLGAIAIPLVAKRKPRQDSGSDEITVGIQADLDEVKTTIAAIFRDAT